MKFIGQYIQSFIARFRNDVYLEDIDTGTIASGAHLGLDSNNKIVKAADGGGDLTSIVAGTGLSGTSLTGPIPTLNVDASQTQITAVGTLTALTVDEITIDGDTITASDDLNIVADGNDITIDTDTFTIESATTSRPFFKLKGVGNNANPSQMWIIKDKGAAGTDGDEIGRIYFVGDDTIQTQTGFGEIKCTIEEADHSNEAGKLELRVANDGTLRNVITGTGIAATAAEVDVTIANGAASVTTIAGTLTMGLTAAMTNGGLLSVASQPNVTTLAGVNSIGTGGNTLSILSDNVELTNTTSNKPILKLFNETDDATGPSIQLWGKRVDTSLQAGEDGDEVGSINFSGYDDQGTPRSQAYAKIIGSIADATSGQEAGNLKLYTASYDGVLTEGLQLLGDTNADGEVDVTIASGAASVTTIAGTLTMGSTAAMGNTGLLTVGAQTGITAAANLVTVGTIGTGVWNATKIAEDKVTQSQIVNLKGYLTLAANYFYAEDHEDAQSPYEMAKDYGSATIGSGTEVTQSSLFRAVGFHVPFACVLDSIQVQASINNTAGSAGGTMTVAVVEYRPSEAGGDTNDYPRTVFHEVEIDATDNNNKIKTVNVSSPSNTAIPAGSHLLLMVKGDSDVVGDRAHISVAMKITY